jgi:hypothetical protein
MADPLASLSMDDFTPLTGETFTVGVRDRAGIPLRLSEVTSLGWNRPRDSGGRESFSTVFHYPRGEAIPQGIHALMHPKLGSFDCFFVPIGPDAQGLRLEAVFNFL